MKRKIIKIDESLCNGCGDCVTACAEGAIQLIDGKARLVKEQYCDGLGDCIGECPTGAITIEERECDDFDLHAAKTHVYQTRGMEGIRELEAAQQRHEAPAANPSGGCPGMKMRMADDTGAAPTPTPAGTDGPAQVIPSELKQWPIQLHLVQPGAPFFNHKELVIMSTCGPLASADTHWRFLRGRSVVVACPKLDRTDGYVEKLAGIFQNQTIPKVLVVRMEVPCCGGLTMMAKQALDQSGRRDLELEEITLSLEGSSLKITK